MRRSIRCVFILPPWSDARCRSPAQCQWGPMIDIHHLGLRGAADLDLWGICKVRRLTLVCPSGSQVHMLGAGVRTGGCCHNGFAYQIAIAPASNFVYRANVVRKAGRRRARAR
ncbi:hypothetical protein C8T65DRAFT_671512 [Cerioporus squamosus]|nr:hypothetical protein C8T65DRAFT_671512 [Cerioporus squamosus]